jgi:two-component system, NtrC family, response regulator AtoC
VPPRISLVGVDANIASTLSGLLSSHGYITEQVLLKPVTFDRDPKPTAIVLSIVDTGIPALNVLVSARKAGPPIPVVVLVGPDQAKMAVEALKLGATDAVVMPADPADLLSILLSIQLRDEGCASGRSKPEYPRQHAADAAVFVSRSPKMMEMWNVATKVARTDVPVLILGESGVGKEVLARFIHRRSRRADNRLVKVNCAALPHDLLESELFGYERGAFTGAMGEKPGKFELADEGCILLDEIGEMPPGLQAKLLHVLEDGEFSRLGGKRPVKVDVRVLASTNRNLHEAIPRGEFRDDLYYRLNVVKISIPPLRERKEDIPLLATYFLKRHRDALASSIQELPRELTDAFMRHDWPGNVRQLENTIRRYLILPELDMELNEFASIPASPREPASPPEPPKRAMAVAAGCAVLPPTDSRVIQFPGPKDSVCLKNVASMAAERTERELVLHVLEQTNWNRSHAARRLNICYRALLNKLKKWQIDRPCAS